MKYIFIALAAIVLASAGWHYRHGFSELGASDSIRPKPIVFDNGTVRDYTPASQASGAVAQIHQSPGLMRKCVKGIEVTYTNFACPQGFKEKTVASDRVTVLTDQRVAQPTQAAQGAGGKPPLRQALDVSVDEGAKERAIERAMGSGSR